MSFSSLPLSRLSVSSSLSIPIVTPRCCSTRAGYEVGRAHYVLMLLLHAAWLAALWWYAWDKPIYWSMIVIYLLVQVARAWMLMALGPRWTMRIIVTPDEPVEASLFTRFLRHPNYLVLALEI